jgi:hypothetical protein
MLADVDAGSDTPSLVGKVLAWRESEPERGTKPSPFSPVSTFLSILASNREAHVCSPLAPGLRGPANSLYDELSGCNETLAQIVKSLSISQVTYPKAYSKALEVFVRPALSIPPLSISPLSIPCRSQSLPPSPLRICILNPPPPPLTLPSPRPSLTHSLHPHSSPPPPPHHHSLPKTRTRPTSSPSFVGKQTSLAES